MNNACQESSNWLQEENELLLAQLQSMQAEMERYYKNAKNQAVQEKFSPVLQGIDSKMVQARISAMRNLLVFDEAMGNCTTFPKGMGESLKFFIKGGYKNEPDATLGGKNFGQAIKIYAKSGLVGLLNLLANGNFTPLVQANCLTAVAKHIREKDKQNCVMLARLAWQIHPRTFRLKWLAFRAYDAGDVVGADIILDMLPLNMEFSNAEKRRIEKIRQEARHELLSGNSVPEKIDEKKETEEFELWIFKNNNDSLKQDLDRLRARLKFETDNFKGRMASLEQANKILSDEKSELKIKNQEDETNLQAFQELDIVQKEKIENLKGENLQLQAQLASLKQKYETGLRDNDRLETECSRISLELSQLKDEYQTLLKRYCELQEEAGLAQAREMEKISRNLEEVGEGFKNWHARLESGLGQLAKTHELQLDNSRRQYASWTALANYFQGNGADQITLWPSGWSASPDYMLELVRLLDRNTYDLVLEFGSGVTTLFVARTAARLESTGRKKPRIFTFEHQDRFAAATGSMLEAEGLSNLVDINLTPLTPYKSPDGREWNYYQCADRLSQYSSQLKKGDAKILVIVDGPPQSTGKEARYPAFPLIMRYFSPANIDFYLDDYRRVDEHEIAEQWKAACLTSGIDCSWEEYDFEKGAFLLKVRPN